ncbi:MAG: hypothetical protein QOE01_2814 [Actinomycetota bacterium]|jgi:hypothetical protein|nr:hypothetical protein [Actinomycetota bacterium]
MSGPTETALAELVGVALRDQDARDPVDVAAGRRLLREMTTPRRARRGRRWLPVLAAVVVAALAVLVVITTLPTHRSAAPAEPTLSSGLPVGTLAGSVMHQHEPTVVFRAHVSLEVRSDGRGVLTFPLTDVSVPINVRYVGDQRGRVSLWSDSPYCSGKPELVIGFSVHEPDGGKSNTSVVLDHVTAGGCSLSPRDAGELTGARLTLQP